MPEEKPNLLIPLAWLAVVAFACFFGAYSGVSNRPTPGFGESSSYQQDLTGKADSQSEPDKRGTPEFPLIVRTEPTDRDAQKIAEDRQERAFNDRVLVFINVVLALATIGLAVFTRKLWGATDRLAIATEGLQAAEVERSGEMRKAHDLADRQFTLAGHQAELAVKQHALRRLEFFAAHPPKLRIRSMVREVFEIGRPVSVSITIANSGSSDAYIFDGDAIPIVSRDGDLPAKRPDWQHRIVSSMPIMKRGESHEYIVTTSYSLRDFEYDSMYGSGANIGVLYVVGFLAYKDGIDNQHVMAFCRRFDTIARRFVVHPDPNYEYED